MGDLGLTQMQLGIVLAAFAWSYAAFQFAGGVWGDRVGARRAITLVALAWGVSNLLIGMVPGPGRASLGLTLAALIALRALMGAMQAPLYPVTGGALTCNWFPVSGWAFPSSLGNAGLTLGAAATGPLIAWLMTTFGWRMSFVMTAPLAFLVAGAWWWYVRDSPSQHSQVSSAELALIDRDRPATLPGAGTGRRRETRPARSAGPAARRRATSAATTSSTSSSTGCSSTWWRNAAFGSSRAASTPRRHGSAARLAPSSAASCATASPRDGASGADIGGWRWPASRSRAR